MLIKASAGYLKSLSPVYRNGKIVCYTTPYVIGLSRVKRSKFQEGKTINVKADEFPIARTRFYEIVKEV